MNKLFNTINNLFESDTPVTLTERGHKYIKDVPDDEVEDKGYSWAKTKVDDRGYKFAARDTKGIASERYLYDVIKHLAPTGYHFKIDKSYGTSRNIALVKDGTDEGFTLASIDFTINADDKPVVTITPASHSIENSGIFNRSITLRDVAQELAREKGAKLDDNFMIDNGAEIKARFEEKKSQNTGTAEELITKIEKQLNKLPAGGIMKQMESVNLTEDWSASAPNWLKNVMKKVNKDNRLSWYTPIFNSDIEFETIDNLNNIRKQAKDAENKGQILFIRIGNNVYWLNNRRWRQVDTPDITMSTEELVDRIEGGKYPIAAVVTTNYDKSKENRHKLQNDRRESRKGSVDRVANPRQASWYDETKYDKSGYKIDPNKYTDMLRTIKQNDLASSDLINVLKDKDYVNKFNELGEKAAKYIGNTITMSFDSDDSSAYGDSLKADFSSVEAVKKVAQEASSAIKTLIRRVNYIKTGDSSSLRYGEAPETTNIEGWLKDQIAVVDDALAKFENLVATVDESQNIEESYVERDIVDDLIAAIEDGFLDWETVGMAALKYMSTDDVKYMIKDNDWNIASDEDLEDFEDSDEDE